MTLATKDNKKKKHISQVRCYQCGLMGYYASKNIEKKKEKTKRDMETSAVVEDYAAKFEQHFFLSLLIPVYGALFFRMHGLLTVRQPNT